MNETTLDTEEDPTCGIPAAESGTGGQRPRGLFSLRLCQLRWAGLLHAELLRPKLQRGLRQCNVSDLEFCAELDPVRAQIRARPPTDFGMGLDGALIPRLWLQSSDLNGI